MAKLSIFFKLLRPHFQNSFVQFFFNVFFAKLKDKTQKKLLKTGHQCKFCVKLALKFFFFKVNYGQIKNFLQNSETTFSKQFFPKVF